MPLKEENWNRRECEHLPLPLCYSLVMESDIMVSDEYDQLHISGVSEHPQKSLDIALPVLEGD